MCYIYEIQHMECTDICIINMHIDFKSISSYKSQKQVSKFTGEALKKES